MVARGVMPVLAAQAAVLAIQIIMRLLPVRLIPLWLGLGVVLDIYCVLTLVRVLQALVCQLLVGILIL